MKKIMYLLKDTKLLRVKIEDNLKSYYEILKCDLIETLNININNNKYTFIFDEEGKLKENYINLVFIDKNYKQIDYIANHLIIQKYDYLNDEVLDLTNDDFIIIQTWYKNCKKLIDFENSRYVPTIEIY